MKRNVMLADNLTMREHAAKKNNRTDACGTPGVTLSDIGKCYPGGVTCLTAAVSERSLSKSQSKRLKAALKSSKTEIEG